MKRWIRIIFITAAIFLGLSVLLAGSIIYTTKYRVTVIDRQVSPDGRGEVTLRMKGEPEWPFGSAYGDIVFRYDGEERAQINITIRDDGAMLRPDSWKQEWGEAGVRITLTGSEQEDEVICLLYDGLRTEDPGLLQLAGEDAEPDARMEQFRELTDAYFAGRNRMHEFVERGEGAPGASVPVVYLNSDSSEEKEWFCADVVNWLLYSMRELPYEGNEAIYASVEIDYWGERFSYIFSNLETLAEDHTAAVYNDLYAFIEEIQQEVYRQRMTLNKEGGADGKEQELSQETVQYYLTLEPDCAYRTADGVEYRMVPVDRACGSSYYALVATADEGISAVMANGDPYLGSGGGAKWISFLEDGQTGFSCLAYGGGAYGSLYRTGDGGKSFQEVQYPSARAVLSDGTYYNPFVMPERVYEEAGKLYMEAGQGPDGDYYGEEGYCHGLYESSDKGTTWSYVGEIPAQRK